jgi:iron complex outermembrane receptor protein
MAALGVTTVLDGLRRRRLYGAQRSVCMRRTGRLFLGLLSLLVPPTLTAQDGMVRGRVTGADGQPLARAAVALDGTGFRTLADQTGRYALAGVPAGTYTLRVRLIGYATATAGVTVRQGEVTQQDVRLEAAAIGLAPVDVIVGSRGRHTAAEELAVPVDVFTAEVIATQGTSETSRSATTGGMSTRGWRRGSAPEARVRQGR